MPFDDNKGPVKKKGLKIDNQNSTVPQPKPNTSEVFNEKATAAASRYEEYKQRTWELSVKFKSMIEDRALPDNKSILSRGVEVEVLNKLVSLASEMNEDDNQPEGIGSTALSFLLMKMLLIQRDTINTLLYKVEKLEKNNTKLENTVNTETNKDK
jgi:hypothetical protein